jgi:hypothetical protein
MTDNNPMTMKKINAYLSVLAVSLICACSKDGTTVQQPLDEGGPVTSLDDTEIICTGGEFTLAFTSNSSWEMKNCPDWLTVSKKSGKQGTTVISFKADINKTRAARTANITFSAKDGSFDKPFKVSQNFPYLRIDTDSLAFNWNAAREKHEGITTDTNTKIVKISSNVQWQIDGLATTKSANVDVNDYGLSAIEGRDDYDLEIIPLRDNYGKTPTDNQVRIYPVMPDANGKLVEIPSEAADNYTVKLHQANLRFLINDSTDDSSIEFSELNDNNNINFTIDAEVPWTVSKCPDWVVMSSRKGEGISTINFLADGATPTTEPRSGIITLTTAAGASRNIEVSQKGYVFSVEDAAVMIGNDDLSEYKFNITTTGTWKITNVPSWLSVSPLECTETTPQSGNQVHEITIKAVGQNLTFDDYGQVLTISSTMNNLSAVKNITQDKFIFDVTPNSTLADLPTMNTTKYATTINSSGRWEITGMPDWIDVSKTSSDIKGLFNITIGANSGNPDITSDRSETLTVTSLNHKDAGQTVTRTIVVKQRKYTFEVSPLTAIDLAAYKQTFGAFAKTVKCSSDWILESYPSWVVPSVTSGDGTTDATIIFTPTINSTKSSRTEDIVVKSLYNNETKSFAVNQDAFVFDNDSKSYDVAVMNTAGFPVTFELTAEAGWTLQSGYPSWLNPSGTSGTGTSTVTFTPDPNPDLSERTGTATILSTVSGENKTITFTQEKYVFDSSAESHTYTELATTSTPLDVTSSGPWTITDAPSWISLSSKSGSTSANLTFAPAKNINTTARSATFNVVSTLNSLKKPVTVSQAAFKFDTSSKSYSFTTLEERTEAISVLCSGKWTAVDVPSWITMSAKSGNGSEFGTTDDITLTSTRNLTESDRSATIKITSSDNTSLVKNIAVSQAKFDFRVSDESFVYTDPLNVDSKSFSVICPATWTASADKTWLNLDTTGGDENGSITLTPEENLTTSDRTATITVTSTLNSLKRTVLVSQPKFIFGLDKSSLTFSSPLADNASQTVNVSCSSDWTASSDADWLTLSKTSGSSNSSFTAVPSLNPGRTSRTATITVTSTKNGLISNVNVTQAAYEFDSSTESIQLEACPSSPANVTILCSGTGRWTASSSASWLTVTAGANFDGSEYVTLQAENNPYESDRTAVITITSSDNTSLKKIINVTQIKHTLDLSASSLSFEAYPGSTKTVTLTTSGPWTISADSWVTVSPSSGTGNATVSVSVPVNSETSPRSATLTVKCANTTLQKSISVSQTAYEFDSDTVTIDCPTVTVPQKSVSITCSGKWTASSDSDWVTLDTTSGTGNATLRLAIADNVSTSAKTAKVTIISTDNPTLKKVVTISQEAYQFNSDAVTIDCPATAVPQKSVSIICSGKWTASSNSDWATLDATSGTGNATLKISITDNATTSVRTAAVTIVSADNPALKKIITINQEATTEQTIIE